jgi:hypothetical protein
LWLQDLQSQVRMMVCVCVGEGRAMVQAVLSPRRPEFAPRSVHMGFVVDIVTLEQVLLLVLRVYPVNIIPPWLFMFIYYLGGVNNKPVCCRSSETRSHHTDMNQNIDRVWQKISVLCGPDAVLLNEGSAVGFRPAHEDGTRHRPTRCPSKPCGDIYVVVWPPELPIAEKALA